MSGEVGLAVVVNGAAMWIEDGIGWMISLFPTLPKSGSQ